MSKKKLRFPKENRLGHLNKDGSEKLCSKPTELRASIVAPLTLRQKMQSMWKELREKDEFQNSVESLADAQDFDIDNSKYIGSPYEVEGELSEELAHAEADEIASKQSEAPAAPADDSEKESSKQEDDA
jgi:hypothetical protein